MSNNIEKVKWCAVDIETTGLNFMKDTILGVGLHCDDGGHSHYYTDIKQAKYAFMGLIEEGYSFTLQNCAFDWRFLKRAGINFEPSFDTMIAAYLLKDRPKALSLDSLAAYYLGLPSWKGDFKSGEAHRDPEVMAAYCLKDCEVTYDLTVNLERRLREEGRMDFFTKLMEARRLLNTAEYTGILVDTQKLETLIMQLDPEITQLELELNKIASAQVNDWVQDQIQEKLDKAGPVGDRKRHLALERIARNPPKFNWSSPKQILWLLKKIGVDVVHPLTKKESSDVTVLERASDNPIVRKLLEMRERVKLLSTLDNTAKTSGGGYKQLIQEDGRIHGSFNLTRTETGRLSSSAPNMQQIDSSDRVRGLFIAPSGYRMLVADLAQIEVRVAAHYSKDATLIETFEKELDFYGIIAVKVLGAKCQPNEVKSSFPELRKIAKIIGLSILYGTGPNRLRNEIKKGTGRDIGLDGAREIIDNYFREFPGLKELQKGVNRTICDRGYLVNLMGRHIDINAEDAFRYGVNYLFQSTASDLLLFRQLEIDNWIRTSGIDARLLALVHDEMVFEVKESDAPKLASIVTQVMEKIADIKFRIPLKIEIGIGDNWACKK